ncbi:hypothetical protein [Caldimonas brevitalea]|uniref:Uncharacterized protein n=1 Tax=Caldimonas brevitalea TaxID=413882 RepID=A0A0G3BZF2_9BURK|nr:hypothetical protein [Caldimonas brevitalea]AKJ31915.1 hypothetical protein AAW51_5224 [Caldimonas brevitalea]
MEIEPAFAVAVIVTVLIFAFLGYETLRSRRNDERIRTTGRPATVVVVSATQTGTWINNNPELALKLKVREEGTAERDLAVEAVVPVQAAALFLPGGVLRVRLDPQNPDTFVFDEPWARPPE